jgi:organic radical activating enzyme
MTDPINIINLDAQPTKIVSLQPKEVLDIRFWPTDICNFNCTYCFPGSKDAVYRYPKNIETVIKNFNLLFDLYKDKHNKQKFNINLVGGGEPTMWPHFKKFCDGIRQHHDVELKVTTNGSRSLRWWEQNGLSVDKVTLSVHHEFADIDHTIKVLDFLHSSGTICTALVLMDAEYFDKCKGIIDRFQESKYPWFIEAKPIVDFEGKDSLSYTEEQKQYMKQDLKRIPDSDFVLNNMHLFRSHDSIAVYKDETIEPKRTSDYINSDTNYYKDWNCNVALENLVIIFDGTVTGSCNAELFKDYNINLFAEDFEEKFNKASFNLSTIKCPFGKCSCQPDTHITKWKF